MTVERATGFDPYEAWLNVEEPRRPLNAYQLLGLAPREDDREAIVAAARRQRAALERCRPTAPPAVWQQIYREVDEAARLLLDADRKAVYDGELGDNGHAAESAAIVDTAGAAMLRCARCHAPNVAVRKFCAQCGSPLWEPCFRCGTLCGKGERFCGACGVNLASAMEEEARQYESALQQAAQLAAEFRYDEALAILRVVARNKLAPLADFAQQAEQRRRQIVAERDRRQAWAQTVLEQAERHAAGHQYEAAARLLGQVPEPLRTDPIRTLLSQMRRRADESSALERELRDPPQTPNLAEWMAKLGRFLALQPDHARAREFAGRLLGRLVQSARNKLAAFQYEAAWRTLRQVPDSFLISAEIEAFRQELAELASLHADLRTAPVADKTLLGVANRLCRLSPSDPQAAKLRHQIEHRLKIAESEPRRGPLPWTTAPAANRLGCPIDWAAGWQRAGFADDARAAAYHEHPGSLWVAYGLALQGLGRGLLEADLYPSDALGMIGRFAHLFRTRTAAAAWGIDLGPTALKAVQLLPARANEGPLVAQCDLRPHRKPLSQALNKNEEQEIIGETLGAFLAANDLKGARVCLGLPSLTVLCRQFQLPPVPEAKLDSAVRYEVRQHVPCSLEELIWDYDVLNAAGDGEPTPPHYEVLLVAARRELVIPYLDGVQKAGLHVDSLQSDAVALYQALAHEHFRPDPAESSSPGGQNESVAMLDVGGDATNFVIGSRRRVWFRTIGFGSHTLTKALAREFKLTFAEAERLKLDPASAPSYSQLCEAVAPSFERLADEIRQALATFAKLSPESRVTRIRGVGGGFCFHGLWGYLRSKPT